MKMTLYISKSRYFLYKTCPYAYKLQYIDNVKPEENIYAIEGIEFHDFAKEFWNRVSIDNGKLIIPKFEIPQTKEVKNFLLYQIERWKKLKKYGLEKYFLPISHEEMLYDKKGMIRGIPDAIFKTPNDSIIVVDYKTTKNVSRDSILSHMKDFLFYDILAGENYGEVIKNVIYYPYINYSYKFDPFPQKTLEDWKCMVEEVKKKILNYEFPKRKGPHCRWCGVRYYCMKDDSSSNW
ncbi:MAG: PD-(D/E)XK nuclease family protein [Candidatus Heimdallarchaeaceae archaeon]